MMPTVNKQVVNKRLTFYKNYKKYNMLKLDNIKYEAFEPHQLKIDIQTSNYTFK